MNYLRFNLGADGLHLPSFMTPLYPFTTALMGSITAASDKCGSWTIPL